MSGRSTLNERSILRSTSTLYSANIVIDLVFVTQYSVMAVPSLNLAIKYSSYQPIGPNLVYILVKVDIFVDNDIAFHILCDIFFYTSIISTGSKHCKSFSKSYSIDIGAGFCFLALTYNVRTVHLKKLGTFIKEHLLTQLLQRKNPLCSKHS